MTLTRLLATLPPAKAIELVDPSVARSAPNPWLVVAAAAIAAVLIAAAIFIWRSAEPEPPLDLAYRQLTRGLGLRRRDRRLLARLAAEHGRASPIALLLSEHAFRTAMSSLWRAHGAESLRADAGRLLNRIHGEPQAR